MFIIFTMFKHCNGRSLRNATDCLVNYYRATFLHCVSGGTPLQWRERGCPLYCIFIKRGPALTHLATGLNCLLMLISWGVDADAER
jgi:hypothetical protein